MTRNENRTSTTWALAFGLLAALSLSSTALAGFLPTSGGGTLADLAVGIETSATGEVYAAGNFQGEASFDGLFVNAQGLSDIYVVKYGLGGSAEWAVSAGGINEAQVTGLALDDSNNAYVTGWFYGDFSYQGVTLVGHETRKNTFILKLNSADGGFGFLTGGIANSGSFGVESTGVTTTRGTPGSGATPPSPGSVIVTGLYRTSSKWGTFIAANDPGNNYPSTSSGSSDGTITAASSGAAVTDMFLARLTQDGLWEYVYDARNIQNISRSPSDSLDKVAGTATGVLYVAGQRQNTVTPTQTVTALSENFNDFNLYDNFSPSNGGYTFVNDPAIPGVGPAMVMQGYASTATSRPIDTSVSSSVRLTANVIRGMDVAGSEHPDPGEDMLVQYLNASGIWVTQATYVGTPEPSGQGQIFTFDVTTSDAQFLHSNFRVRFWLIAASGGFYDAWHIDNVTIRKQDVNTEPFLAKISNAGINTPRQDASFTLPTGFNLKDLFATDTELVIAGSASASFGLSGNCPSQDVVAGGGFVAQLDGNTLSCDWIDAQTSTSGFAPAVNGVTADSSGNVYGVGTFRNDVSVDVGAVPVSLDATEGCNGLNQDVFVLSYNDSGQLRWLTGGGTYVDGGQPALAGGPGCDTGVSISTDGLANLNIVGNFTDMSTFGEEAQVISIGETDMFLANLGLDGLFFQISGWTVGTPIPPPPGAKTDEIVFKPDFYMDGLRVDAETLQVVYVAPPVEDGNIRVIPLQSVGNLEVRWRVSDDLTDEQRIGQTGATFYPGQACSDFVSSECFQVHVASAPVELTPPDGSHTVLLRINPSVGGSNDEAATPQDPFQPDRTGYTSIVYVRGPQPDPVQYQAVVEVVRTLPYSSLGSSRYLPNVPWEIGLKVSDPDHDELGRTGYTINERAPYDGTGTDASYDRGGRTGAIIPVNRLDPLARPQDVGRELVVAWYRRNDKGVYWADKAVSYDPFWPLNPDKIIVASEQGGENLGQEPLNPLVFPAASIYIQPDPLKPGYNPNDEHALFVPSQTGTGINAVFALRSDFGLNIQGDDSSASDPYVLVKYWNASDAEWNFRVFEVNGTGAGFNDFRYSGVAGSPVNPPYPLSLIPGCSGTRFVDPDTGILLGAGQTPPPPFFQDYTNKVWAKSAGSGSAAYQYPLQPGFFYDIDNNDTQDEGFDTGVCVNWLPRLPLAEGGTDDPNASILVGYDIYWPEFAPTLVIGDTLLDPKLGLPAIRTQAAVEVVFDELQDTTQDASPDFRLTQLIDPLNPRSVRLPAIPPAIATELDNQGRDVILGSADGIQKLAVSIKDRIRYDSLNGILSVQGINDDSGIEPLVILNVLSKRDRVALKKLDGGDGSEQATYTGKCEFGSSCTWDQAIEALFRLSRNPQGITKVCTQSMVDEGGVRTCQNSRNVDEDDVLIGLRDDGDDGILEPFSAVGVAPALTAGFAQGSGFVTLAFNNDPSLTPLPISLNVIRVDCLQSPPPPVLPTNADIYAPYQGSIVVLSPENIFDEQLVLRHSGNFGGATDELEFQWFFQPAQGLGPPEQLPNPETGQLNGWLNYPVDDPMGANEIEIKGANIMTLSDNWFVVRYRGLPQCDNATNFSLFSGDPTGTPLEPRPQLAEGWVKRVVKRLNPFEARVQNFAQAATNNYASMLVQLGERYEGDIALNNDPDNLNSIGLIEAYTTVMRRAMTLSVNATPPVNYGPANDAILFVASRIVEFYSLLGNEAYADAQDPTIGIDSNDGLNSLAPSIFTFQNQLASQLEEELTLMRGRDDTQGGVAGSPVYNRLFWNFTTGEGEVAYALNYNISDQNFDGVLDEFDARILYPQGHGDAWGHFLTAMDIYYDLLNHPFFTWQARAENITVAGAPIGVDFQDERQFAETAAQKARTGAEIVDLTYRNSYVADPQGQYQGYRDELDPDRAWGVSEWASRTGRGAYLDWVVGNSIIPAVEPDPTKVGIQQVDRYTTEELNQIVSAYNDIQTQIDEADKGLNPLGLANGVVPFDIDPSRIDDGDTHFEQIFERAMNALENVIVSWDFANRLTSMLRFNQDEVEELQRDSNDTEADFKSRLIEIFGYPYPDDIGPGGTYPANYDGPDLYHYMYVDRNELEGTAFDLDGCPVNDTTCNPTALLPATLQRFDGVYAPVANGFDYFTIVGESEGLDCGSSPLGSGCSLGGLNLCPRDANNQPIDPTCNQDNPSTDALLTVEYTMMNSQLSGFGFTKPPEWNTIRRAPGSIQEILGEIYQAQISMQRAFREYDNLRRDIEDDIDTIKATFDIQQEQISIANAERKELNQLTITSEVFKNSAIVAKRAGAIIEDGFTVAKTCVPGSFVAGFSNGGDVFSSLKCTLQGGGISAKAIGEAIGDGLDIVANATSAAKEDVSLQAAIESQVQDARLELFNQKGALDRELRQEPLLRAEIYQTAETINTLNGKYLSTLAEGQRLLQELITFRRTGAAAVQEHRYNDLAFRLFRNDALQKYRATFNLGAKYAYLAATAYDYETNLLGSNAQAGQNFLTDIVKQRAAGQVLRSRGGTSASPVAGTVGLADPLARMGLNFEVLKGQMGFNNPQIETNRFSLRDELFRIPRTPEGDEQWRDLLRDNLVSDVRGISAFNRFARPFAPESAGPQPAVILSFPTTVSFGLNYFGNALQAGDSSYDSSNFATKVRSVGVWFEDYGELPLSLTPRVYLFPIGADILRAPAADNFSTREWNVLDQKIPVPFPIGSQDLQNPNWIPSSDTVIGSNVEVRRYSRFRAYPFTETFDDSETSSDSRLIGRSVWNREWLLIIPGESLLADPSEALDIFIDGDLVPGGVERDGAGVSDIKLFFKTYAYSGN